MKASDLPVVGVPTNSGGHDFFGQWSNLAGKKVLCIGFTEAEATNYVDRHGPASIDLLTNWTEHVDAQAQRFPLTIGDITKRTKFADDTFDAVLTLSVLEHLNGLHDAFVEMARVIKPGGEMLHMFGPAWSCPFGNHIYADPSDPNLNFVLWKLPAHMHLLCSVDEIAAYYSRLGYPVGTERMVMHWFHETPLINRVFYDDYVTEMEMFQIDRMELMYNNLPTDHLARLRKMFPGRRDFSTYGGRYRLIVQK